MALSEVLETRHWKSLGLLLMGWGLILRLSSIFKFLYLSLFI
ncbi:hypothetical protein BN1221_02926c [Brenneria goodwinii]|uniref:Uncharacterized protein n=1 Tax=Brenneria goodwinii TaxID=1109412 RepID=A0A0G4JWX3_9GAMM|nr:hypothetical protein BN1221_02926c [Brenneria goodwinii]